MNLVCYKPKTNRHIYVSMCYVLCVMCMLETSVIFIRALQEINEGTLTNVKPRDSYFKLSDWKY